MESSYLDIDLHLKGLKYLFVDPELNPFEDHRLQISGVEEAANFLRTKERKEDKIRMNIFLPSGQIEPDLKVRTAEALSRYCDFKILQNQHQLKIERSEGRRAVVIGMIFSVICLLMVSLIYLLGSVSETLLVIFIGFFTILIWMAIWTPAETFLYGLQPYKLEIITYKSLKNAEIVIREEP
jgi:hypothetical protein